MWSCTYPIGKNTVVGTIGPTMVPSSVVGTICHVSLHLVGILKLVWFVYQTE